MNGRTSADSPIIDIPLLIDRRGIGRFQLGVVLLCGLVLFLDGFDTQAISYIAPILARQWTLPKEVLGWVFSAALIGLMVGYLLVSPASDRFGHKRVLVLSTIMFAVFTLVTAMASDATQLIVLRFLTGIGLGAAAPSAVALTGEYVPKHLRATCVLAIYCGFSLGFIFAGICAAPLLPSFGWRSLLYIGSLLPLLMVIPLLAILPESLEFLVRRRNDVERVGAILRRLAPDLSFPATARYAVTAREGRGNGILSLFRERRAIGTILLWLVFIINLAQFYLTQSWFPTILTSLHYSMNTTVTATTLSTVGGVVAAFVIGPAMDRIGPYRALTIVYLVGGVFVALTGAVFVAPLWMLLAVAFASGFCVSGGQKSVIALAAIYYPTSIRSTGVGWALGIGRVGGIAGPLIVGLLLQWQWTPQLIFHVLGIPMIGAAAAIHVMGRIYQPGSPRGVAPARVAPKAGQG